MDIYFEIYILFVVAGMHRSSASNGNVYVHVSVYFFFSYKIEERT